MGRLAVFILPAIRAYHFGILVGHLMQEGGKLLAALVTQHIDRFLIHRFFAHEFAPTSSALRNQPLLCPLE